jgi:hypothetical protein
VLPPPSTTKLLFPTPSTPPAAASTPSSRRCCWSYWTASTAAENVCCACVCVDQGEDWQHVRPAQQQVLLFTGRQDRQAEYTGRESRQRQQAEQADSAIQCQLERIECRMKCDPAVCRQMTRWSALLLGV